MKLYDPGSANDYIWPMVPKGAKPTDPCQYKPTRDENPGLWTDKGWTMAGAHCMGRYDSEGLWQTYCPPVPGAHGAQGLGRFIPHPLAKTERDREKAQREAANSWQRRAA